MHIQIFRSFGSLADITISPIIQLWYLTKNTYNETGPIILPYGSPYKKHEN